MRFAISTCLPTPWARSVGASLAIAHSIAPQSAGLLAALEQKSAAYDAVRHGKRQAFDALRGVRDGATEK